MFWKDRWINGACIVKVAPLIVAKVKTKVRKQENSKGGIVFPCLDYGHPRRNVH